MTLILSSFIFASKTELLNRNLNLIDDLPIGGVWLREWLGDLVVHQLLDLLRGCLVLFHQSIHFDAWHQSVPSRYFDI